MHDDVHTGEPEIRIRERATRQETAAVTAAVLATARVERPRRPAMPWLRAALHEGLGGRPAAQPSDLGSRGPSSP
jgi:hypothetical protein